MQNSRRRARGRRAQKKGSADSTTDLRSTTIIGTCFLEWQPLRLNLPWFWVRPSHLSVYIITQRRKLVKCFLKIFLFFYGNARARLGEHLFAQKISLRLGLRKFDRHAVKSDLPLHRRFAAKLSKRASLAPVALAQTLVSIKRALTTSIEIRNS